MKLRIASGYSPGFGYSRHWFYDMTSIPFNNQRGQVVGLEVKPAADGSGDYVPVVRIENPSDIDLGGVSLPDLETDLQVQGQLPDKMIVTGLVYHAAPPTVISGRAVSLQGDQNGNLKVDIAAAEIAMNASLDGPLPAGANIIGGVYAAPTDSANFSISPGSSHGFEASRVIKASPGNLYSLYVVTGAIGGYLMTFDAATVPVDGAVAPIECIPVPPNSIGSISCDGSPPDHYSMGIAVAFSTTGPFVKTTAGFGLGPYGDGMFGDPTAIGIFFKWRAK